MNYLTVEDVLAIAAQAGFQVRDMGLLASATARPEASAFGEDAYPTPALKTAALIDSINRNRPLVDGNKQLSWFGAVVFVRLNGFDIAAEPDDAEQLIVAVAAGTADLPMLAQWIESDKADSRATCRRPRARPEAG